MRRILPCILLALLTTAPASGAGSERVKQLVEGYLAKYFETYPSQATEAGLHDHDYRLESLDDETRAEWLRFNQTVVGRTHSLLASPLPADDRFDLELLRRQAQREVLTYGRLRRPERDPLFWTGILGNATVFLLVRDDLPATERLDSAAARAGRIPRLVNQARQALRSGDAADVAPELCEIAAAQAEASARFYAEGFARAGDGESEALRAKLAASGERASAALAGLATFLRELQQRATGSPRLGDHYAELFAVATGVDATPDEIFDRATAALAAKRREAAAFGRAAWSSYFPDSEAPGDDDELLRRLFDRVARDHAADTDAFVEDYRRLVAASTEFVRARKLITLPEPLTLVVDRSPAYFVGQSVGGVYPAGPYSPEGKTLLFVPTPPDSADDEQRAAFFRDFNDHFNVMITPHEIIPGHYLQLKLAARHPHKVRALFGDGVYIEGWGTFCERLMLDLGWGDPLDRLAHLKKQLENIARTIVDIGVHTRGMTREQVLAFVRDEALQDEQFAANMWRRSITSAPQLTFYFLGYEEVWRLYDNVRSQAGESFDLRGFMDGMMEFGPVPLRYYKTRMLRAEPTGDAQKR